MANNITYIKNWRDYIVVVDGKETNYFIAKGFCSYDIMDKGNLSLNEYYNKLKDLDKDIEAKHQFIKNSYVKKNINSLTEAKNIIKKLLK